MSTRVSNYNAKKSKAIISRLEKNKKHIEKMKQTIKAIEGFDKKWRSIHRGKETMVARPKIKLGNDIITPTELIKEMKKKIKALQEGRANVKGRKQKTSKRRIKGKGNKANTRKKCMGKKCKTHGKKKIKKSNKKKTRRRRRN